MRKLYFVALVYVSGILNLTGQYESGITIPDTTLAISKDSNDVSIKLANTIQAEDLRAHLSVIASDAFEGRETGTEGNDKAAEYISKYFKSLGIKAPGPENSYYQKVAFNKSFWEKNLFSVNEKTYRHLWDYIVFPTITDNFSEFTTEEVIFLGYGIDSPKYSDYKGNKIEGKIIMINKGEPISKDGISFVSGTAEKSEWAENIELKLTTAYNKGAKLVLIIEEDLKQFLDKNRRFLVSPSLRLGDGTIGERIMANHIYISSTIAKDIIGDKAEKIKKWRKKNASKGKACDFKLSPTLTIQLEKTVQTIKGQNVYAFLEGSDKKDELIVVSAHYDHLGKRGKEIFNGADDNGTGTSTLLEITEALVEAIHSGNRPRRSIMILLVTGEEKGLLGSRYYAENPLFPIENTVANVNVDMIGRVDTKHADDADYIYVIGSDRLSSDLHKINESLNQKYTQISLDYQYNGENDPNRYYYRSDHYNFAQKGIPAIFFFSGTHEDYHQPSDTIDKIMFDKMTKIGRHIFHLVWELANREDRIMVDGAVSN